jgi:hypothetical protein
MNKSFKEWNNLWIKLANENFEDIKTFHDLGKNIALAMNDWAEERKELIEALNSIPCLCNEGYETRNMIDPYCPRCNWVDTEFLNKLEEK